jgi:signal transduction histidine kinase
VAWNQKGEIIKINPGMQDLLGMAPSPFGAGPELASAFPADARHRLEAAAPEEVLRINLVHGDGGLRAVEARVGKVVHPGGELRIAVIRDVSAQVDRERRLLQFQWQIQLGRQIASVARDLERALNPLFLAQQILQPDQPVSPAHTEAWQVLRRSSEQAALLLRQFTRMAGNADESSDVRVFDLQASLIEVIEAFQADRGTAAIIEMDLHPAGWPIRGSVSLVRRSFELLIQRGLDVSAGTRPIRVKSRQEFGMCMIDILDPGTPHSELDPSRMFDPVFCLAGTAADTAFGLFNVQETMKSMGGSATVVRTPSGWTQFTLQFPLGAAL